LANGRQPDIVGEFNIIKTNHREILTARAARAHARL
jgi:hypothetical protein